MTTATTAAGPTPDGRTWIQRLPLYYGWVNVLLAGLAMTATLPGRTHGLGLITEPLLADLHFDRVVFANINLAATVVGAIFALAAGWLIDRIGVRASAVLIGVALSASVFALSSTTGVFAFLAALTLIRGFGQSALSVVSLAMIGKWFIRRIGPAMGLFSILLTIGFIVTVLSVGDAVKSAAGPVTGNPPVYAHPEQWRTVWIGVGLWLLVGFVPLAWLLVRDTPESCGLAPDLPVAEAVHDPASDYTLADALRTPAFLVFAAATSFFNLIWSGVTLFNESILAEKGIPQEASVQTLAILTAGGMLANLTAGPFAKRQNLGWLLGVGMGVLAVALGVFPWITTTGQIYIYAAALGTAGGVITVVFFAVWGSLFGRAQLGRIQGAAQVLATLASAAGPLVLAFSKESLGSYSPGLTTLALVTAVLASACLWVRLPDQHATKDVATSHR